jgi:Ala-tRNA(Pro) deacylase
MTAYDRLIELLERNDAQFRLIDHAPEGRADVVSPLRGHATREAAKCIILLVKKDRNSQFVLAVVPGDARVDMEAIKRLERGRFARFAEQHVAEKLSGCVAGTILPFAWDEKLKLLVDPAVAGSETLYFNAGRLDRSVALRTADYLRIAEPRIEKIAVAAAGTA